MRDIDAVLGDLAALRSEIDALGDTDPARGIELRERREGLRAEAGAIHDAAHPGGMERRWRAESIELEAAWDRLAHTRIDVVKQAGGGSAGGDFGFAADAQHLNRVIDEVHGRAQIEDRIKELRSLPAEPEH